LRDSLRRGVREEAERDAIPLVSRRDDERLEDVAEALAAIKGHLRRGTLNDRLVFDAVRVRLIEIGEAVKRSISIFSLASPISLGMTSPGCATDWRIARLRRES